MSTSEEEAASEPVATPTIRGVATVFQLSGDHTFVLTLVSAHTIVPRHFYAHTRLCQDTFVPTHVCAYTRLCPDTFIHTHVCAHTRLCQDTFVPTHICAQIRLYPHTFVPTHVWDYTRLCPRNICALTCYNRVVTIMSVHKRVWTQTCVGTNMYVCAQIRLCPDTYFCALTCYNKITKYSSRNTAGDYWTVVK